MSISEEEIREGLLFAEENGMLERNGDSVRLTPIGSAFYDAALICDGLAPWAWRVLVALRRVTQ